MQVNGVTDVNAQDCALAMAAVDHQSMRASEVCNLIRFFYVCIRVCMVARVDGVICYHFVVCIRHHYENDLFPIRIANCNSLCSSFVFLLLTITAMLTTDANTNTNNTSDSNDNTTTNANTNTNHHHDNNISTTAKY